MFDTNMRKIQKTDISIKANMNISRNMNKVSDLNILFAYYITIMVE